MARPFNCKKCRKPKTRCECGRPTVFTPEVIQKLEQAFELDCTDAEACLHAGIAKTSLWNYEKKNPEFVIRKQALRERPFLIARNTIISEIRTNAELALKYMERKKKGEFSLRNELSGPEGKPLGVAWLPKKDNKSKSGE